MGLKGSITRTPTDVASSLLSGDEATSEDSWRRISSSCGSVIPPSGRSGPFSLPGLGVASRGQAWQARHGGSRHGTARHGTAGKARSGIAGRGKARQARFGVARSVEAGCGRVRQAWQAWQAWQGEAWSGKAGCGSAGVVWPGSAR